jgi:hypothetical protein
MLEKECDDVLNLLDKQKMPRNNTTGDVSTKEWFYHFIKENLAYISEQDLDTIFAILYSDSFIENLRGSTGVPSSSHGTRVQFTISPTGVAFINTNSYFFRKKKIEKQNKIKGLKDNFLIYGSWMAGIGTLALALVEIYKIIHSHN